MSFRVCTEFKGPELRLRGRTSLPGGGPILEQGEATLGWKAEETGFGWPQWSHEMQS